MTSSRISVPLAFALVATLAGCRNAEQAQTPPPTLVAQQQPIEAPDPRFDVDVRDADLAAREAEVARREAEVAQREAAVIAAPPVRQAVVRPAAPRVTPRPTVVQDRPVYQEPVRGVDREPRSSTMTVPSGTSVAAEMLQTVSSATAAPGDGVSARVSDNVYADGGLAIPAGSRLYGTVTAAQGLRRVGGRASLAVDFTRLELPSGQTVPISASYSRVGRSETPKDAGTIAGSAAAGAVLGHQVYKRHRDKGTAIGAVVGGVIGTAVANRTRGEEVELGAGSVVDLNLEGPVTVRARG
jgi:uncharacterized protein YcfJ